MNNAPFHAPIKAPIRILDIGCGTGIMTAQLARAFPAAEVIGLDISAVPARHEQPANATFVQGNIMELANSDTDPRFRAASFDYVFHRLLVLGITDWPAYISAVQGLLSPGGWCEMQDLDLHVLDGEGAAVSDSWSFFPLIHADCKAMGLDTSVGRKLSALLKQAGQLEDVRETVYKIPYETPEMADPAVKARVHAARSAQNRALVERVCGARRSGEEVERIVLGMEGELAKVKAGDHGRLFVVVGRKA